MSNGAEQAKRIAIVAAVAFVAANVVFYFLSGSYFDSHHQIVPGQGTVSVFSPAQMTQIRVSFAVFSGVVAGAGMLAAMWPRVVGHVIPLGLSLAHFAFGCYALTREGSTGALWISLFISGGLLPVLAHYSFRERSRAAWSFLIAICAVFAVVEFFGAPKVRASLDIGLWTTMIFPGLNAVAVWALVSLRAQYVDRAVSASAA